MLRSPQIRRKASQPFICWKCAAKVHSGALYRARVLKHDAPLSRLESRTFCHQSLGKRGTRYFSVVPIRYASNEILSNENPLDYNPPPRKPPAIRQHLRQWELENAASFVLPPEPPHTVGQGDLLNGLTRTNDGDYQIELDITEHDEDSAPLMTYGTDELLDVGNRRGFLLAGDLVELRGVIGQSQELAIFVRELENQSQFYTMSGKWIHRSSQSAHFFVPKFVDPAELDGILPFLPTTDVSTSMRDKLQEFPSTVPRDWGKSLILKMLDFWAKSDETYQSASARLDSVHGHVAEKGKHEFAYATLEEIAEKVLPNITSRSEEGRFPAHVLFAVHRSLFCDDIGFRPQTKGTLRTGGQYEISPLKETWNVMQVRSLVRSHRELQAAITSGHKPSSRSQLEQFAVAAQHLIDRSRRSRRFTAHGTVGPPEKWQESDDTLLKKHRNSITNVSNRKFVLFLISWAGFSSFGNQSSLNGIGSEILRSIGRYGEVDLGPTTAWTFLQEIGVISPWESRVSFDLRLRSVYGDSNLDSSGAPSPHLTHDRLQLLRKDWGDLPVYCIDDPGAHEIDDGISVEATAMVGEYWVHIHTADPASHIQPGSETAAFAESAIENIYMPERVVSILNMETVKAHFSLDSNRPSMTFSARMNKEGHLLETKITPGRVHNVLFLSPAVMEEVVLGHTSSKGDENVRVVGPDVTESSPSRPMLQTHELSDTHKCDLQLLHEIGDAHAALLRAKGGVDQNFPPRAKTSVSISKEIREQSYSGDPTIQLSTVGDTTGSNAALPIQSNLVQSFMLVAAQVAARWCNERGIPVTYRVTPRNPAKEDPSEFFLRKVVPSRAENGVASTDITSEYLRLIGGVLPSTTPGPHAAVGVDMMVRCTSPLRRFTDLLVHWQVGATLLEEDQLGGSLVGNTKDDFLPFSRARVDALLPRLDTREKLIKYGKNEADRHWLCFYLLRAWEFKEAEIPSTFPFLVRNINLEERKISGMLTDFTARAQCSVPDDMDLAKIQEGDKLEVELENVNVYTRKIEVKAVRRLEVHGDV